MNCDNDYISTKLTDFFSGHLSESDRGLVEDHLVSCADCQTALRTMKVLAGMPAENVYLNADNHLDSGLLAQYYESPKELSETAIGIVETHLKECDQCAYELGFLRDMEQELARSVVTQTESSSVLERVLSFIFALPRKPAFAYFLLVVTFYPAYKWLSMESPVQVAEPSYVLYDGTRSGGDIPTVLRSEADSIIRVALGYYHIQSDFEYEFLISSTDLSQTYEVQKISSFKVPDSIRIIVNTADLSDGPYNLMILEVDRDNFLDTTFLAYPFLLSTQ